MRTLAIILTLVLIGSSAVLAGERPPNVILIFTDDQGYADVGVYGSEAFGFSTPNLDRMASQGVRFTDYYSASSVCTPSRAALLTGSFPARTGTTRVLFPRDDRGLNPNEVTVAELLKTRGYATACIGKWHLGHRTEFLPTSQGFDFYWGVPYSNDMWIDPRAPLADDIVLNDEVTREWIRATDDPSEQRRRNEVPLMINEQVVEYPVAQDQLTRRATAEAVRFIEANREKPFFLYMPHSMPHIPLHASEKFRGATERGLYGDVIEEIDWSVGEILKALDRLDLDENTLVIFTTDNGPWKLDKGRGGHADPLRGHKFSVYEGGMRVPAIMRWPGRIPAGTVQREVAASIDLMPTIARLAGAELPRDRVIDGHDIWPLMTSEQGARSPHEAYYYYGANSDRLAAVREGEWKYHAAFRDQPEQLYHLGRDIGETTNVAAEHPDVVARLKERMERFDAELKANRRPEGILAELPKTE